MDATNKFTGKAELYTQYRPSYPDALIQSLIELYQLDAASVIADVGAGTGIFSAQLLKHGLRVIAVEPNADMREAAESMLNGYDRYSSINGTAEATGIAAASVDLVTAAQAYHWFDPVRFRAECRRILKPGGHAALVWNSRVHSSELVMENAEICRQYCSAFNGFSGGMEERADSISQLFEDGVYEVIRFNNDLLFDLNGFIGRNLSASYAPKQGEPTYEPFVEALTALFHRFSEGGKLLMPNETRCYRGKV